MLRTHVIRNPIAAVVLTAALLFGSATPAAADSNAEFAAWYDASQENRDYYHWHEWVHASPENEAYWRWKTEQQNRSQAYSSGGTPDSNRHLGSQMAAQRGWTGSQWNCLNALWQKESGWSHTIWNKQGSGAYGIPQALPGSKMSSHGSDWKTNPRVQIAWGLDYVAGRYGTPCGAWSHSQRRGWY